MTLDEAIELLEDNGYILEEDFGIGVGAPCGLDQGIPHGGDCIGVMPVRMSGCARRLPPPWPTRFSPINAVHMPAYWLRQAKKKRKKKKRKK